MSWFELCWVIHPLHTLPYLASQHLGRGGCSAVVPQDTEFPSMDSQPASKQASKPTHMWCAFDQSLHLKLTSLNQTKVTSFKKIILCLCFSWVQTRLPISVACYLNWSHSSVMAIVNSLEGKSHGHTSGKMGIAMFPSLPPPPLPSCCVCVYGCCCLLLQMFHI